MTWTGQRTWHSVLRAAFLTVVFALSSCVSPPQSSQPATFGARPKRVPLPLQGNFMILPPEAIQQKYGCVASRKTLLNLEELRLIPESVKAGEKMNQIASYAFCPSSAATRTYGRIARVVSFEGKQLLRDVTEGYEFKPGSWAVGAFITIPSGAKSGVYALDVTMTYKNQVATQRKLFFVQASLTP